jgi:hypothetical protein
MRKISFLLAVSAAVGAGAGLTADEIMARVATNQERSLEARNSWIYRQLVLTRLHRTNGRLAREEEKEFSVAPTQSGFDKKLVRFAGKYDQKGKLIDYDTPGYEYKEMDIDGELADEFADDLVSDKGARDGLSPGLFPLAGAQQKKYTFKLAGRERYKDHDVYKVTFQPKKAGLEEGDAFWGGEVLVDATEFQPVLITTHQARGIPMAVKMLLGTNVKHLGFKVRYKRIEDGVWFPVSCGGEFSLRALFFYGRKISISMINSGFQKTDVQSHVVEGSVEPIRTAELPPGPL